MGCMGTDNGENPDVYQNIHSTASPLPSGKVDWKSLSYDEEHTNLLPSYVRGLLGDALEAKSENMELYRL